MPVAVAEVRGLDACVGEGGRLTGVLRYAELINEILIVVVWNEHGSVKSIDQERRRDLIIFNGRGIVVDDRFNAKV